MKLSALSEVYEQKLPASVDPYKRSNFYSYLRSKNGFGGECIVIAAPLDYPASIAYTLTFVDAMARNKPDW